MNNLDKFRYSYDDPSQLNISLKKDPYKKVNDLKLISLTISDRDNLLSFNI